MRSSVIGSSLIAIREVTVSQEQAQVRVHIARSVLYTSELPGFDRRLLQRLPQLGTTICHNDHNLSFAEELRATEMGHVLEHVVLALLTEQRIYAKGMTEWNWFDEPEGTFAITLLGDQLSSPVVEETLARAIGVLDLLLPAPGEYAAPVWAEMSRPLTGHSSGAQP